MKSKAPRDIVFDELLKRTARGEDIYIVTADFGSPSLEKFKIAFPHRLVNVGIAEQNAILVSTGLALEGKKVFVYGIASFIIMRCFEQIRVDLDGMDLPVTIIGVGADDSYKEAGFTHWAFEDIGILKTLKHMVVYDVKDKKRIAKIVNDCFKKPHPKYIRLRRK
jgi:transketolase